MYSLHDYGAMLRDETHMAAYLEALHQVIKPGCIVLDIETGIGIFALLACQFGAGHVHAIESNDVIHMARKIAAINGYTDRITFHQEISTNVNFPEKVDVVVSDIRGCLPLSGRRIPSIIDARERFLAEDGVLISRRDRLFAVLVESPQHYHDLTAPWDTTMSDVDLEAIRRLILNNFSTYRRDQDWAWNKLVTPVHWATIEYHKIDSPNVAGHLEMTVTQAGTAHGFIVWFDSTLIADISFTNAPDQPELAYGSAFFPLEQPVAVSVGDTVSLELYANLVDDDYIWRWHIRIMSSDDHRVKANLSQSTFEGKLLSLENLKRTASRHRPRLNTQGVLDRCVIDLMNGAHSLEYIATQVMTTFPGQFACWKEAFATVSKLSLRYSQ